MRTLEKQQIPDSWRQRRIRFDTLVNPVKSELERVEDTEVSFVPMEAIGEYGGLNIDQSKPISEVYNGYTYFKNGDVCIAKITPCFENGKGALADGLLNGVAFGTTELHIIRPSAEIDKKFLFYLTIAHNFRSYGESEMLGAGGQKRVPERFLKNWMPPLPLLNTQRRITAFLDEKTARIDGLIAKKRELLKRLTEKRQALITQGVTKGLTPDAPMKPSGIDWLGDIPAHWEVVPLRRIAQKVSTGRTPPSSGADYFGGDIFWFTPGDFREGISLEGSSRKISEDAITDGVASLFPPETIYLVGIGATLGKVAVGTCSGSANQQINAIELVEGNNPYYLAYFLHAFRNEVRVTSNGNTLGILNQDGTKSLTVLKVPSDEQNAIVNLLLTNEECQQNAMNAIFLSIERLTEYRSALITAAVAGQIEDLQ